MISFYFASFVRVKRVYSFTDLIVQASYCFELCRSIMNQIFLHQLIVIFYLFQNNLLLHIISKYEVCVLCPSINFRGVSEMVWSLTVFCNISFSPSTLDLAPFTTTVCCLFVTNDFNHFIMHLSFPFINSFFKVSHDLCHHMR